MKKIIYFIGFLVLIINASAFAMERFDIITTQQLKQMLDDRSLNKTDFILVNGLDEIIYRDSSIPGSVNVPWSNVDKMAYRLGEDKNKLIITY